MLSLCALTQARYESSRSLIKEELARQKIIDEYQDAFDELTADLPAVSFTMKPPVERRVSSTKMQRYSVLDEGGSPLFASLTSFAEDYVAAQEELSRPKERPGDPLRERLEGSGVTLGQAATERYEKLRQAAKRIRDIDYSLREFHDDMVSSYALTDMILRGAEVGTLLVLSMAFTLVIDDAR